MECTEKTRLAGFVGLLAADAIGFENDFREEKGEDCRNKPGRLGVN